MGLLEKLGFRVSFVGLLALLAYYAQQHSITAADFNAAFASVPVPALLVALVFDYGLDSGKLYSRMFGKMKRAGLGFVFGLAVVAVFFFAFTWLVAGSVTLNLAAVSPATLVVAGLFALVVLLPNTGTSEWLFWAWLAMQLVTGGQHLAILPGGGVIG